MWHTRIEHQEWDGDDYIPKVKNMVSHSRPGLAVDGPRDVGVQFYRVQTERELVVMRMSNIRGITIRQFYEDLPWDEITGEGHAHRPDGETRFGEEHPGFPTGGTE